MTNSAQLANYLMKHTRLKIISRTPSRIHMQSVKGLRVLLTETNMFTSVNVLVETQGGTVTYQNTFSQCENTCELTPFALELALASIQLHI
ncbi:hypothetical protein [Vibrio phage YC]|uniref:Uncharacterized protein n=1 Tax=Vibrio phage YC TaxID=2267403 RepID=A0A384ZS58_9CAUD|nr:hypothetical protein HWB64_gp098 [Vibrio phage YC]AXC34467.1 hypothetical protein [Vibrio phage YC]